MFKMRLISTQVVMDALDTTGPGCNVALEEAIATAELMVRDI